MLAAMKNNHGSAETLDLSLCAAHKLTRSAEILLDVLCMSFLRVVKNRLNDDDEVQHRCLMGVPSLFFFERFHPHRS